MTTSRSNLHITDQNLSAFMRVSLKKGGRLVNDHLVNFGNSFYNPIDRLNYMYMYICRAAELLSIYSFIL